MTYRGVYRDGYVKLNGDVDLRNGAEVEVHSLREKRRAKMGRVSRRPASNIDKVTGGWARAMAKSKRMTKKQRMAAFLAAFGGWKDRPEWKGMTSVEIAKELRRRSTRRGGRG